MATWVASRIVLAVLVLATTSWTVYANWEQLAGTTQPEPI